MNNAIPAIGATSRSTRPQAFRARLALALLAALAVLPPLSGGTVAHPAVQGGSPVPQAPGAGPGAAPTVYACPDFQDVRPGDPHHVAVAVATCGGALEAYECGHDPGEPCGSAKLPYFRPTAPLTRGRLARLIAVSVVADWTIPPQQQTFRDVPPAHPFWNDIERLAALGLLNGYADGTFRPDALVPRDQLARSVVQARGVELPEITALRTVRPADAASRGDATGAVCALMLSSYRWMPPGGAFIMVPNLLQDFEDWIKGR